MWIETFEDYDKLKYKELAEFNCKQCGSKVSAVKQSKAQYLKRQRQMLCRACQSKNNSKGVMELVKSLGVCFESYKSYLKRYNLNPNNPEDLQKLKDICSKSKKERRSENVKEGWRKSIEEEKNLLSKSLGKELCTIKELSLELGYDPSWLTRMDNVVKGKLANYFPIEEKENLKQLLGPVKGSISISEKEVLDFVKSVYKGEIIENSRKVISPKEVDIYLPKENLAFEFDGVYYHSDRQPGQLIPSNAYKLWAKNRHLEKTIMCEEKGIRLIHIFEDDWRFKRDILESIICQFLGVTKEKIPARKCNIEPLTSKQYKSFLEENHMLGYSAADLKLGLYYKGELVECIGFNTKGTHSKEPELVRLCSKKYTNVVGGFSKLIKHSGLTHFTSYIDRSFYSGKGYLKTGFEIVKENPPSFYWVGNTGVRIPRAKFMKKKLPNLYKKGELKYFNPSETEEVNMYKNGYHKIWNCGTIKVEWSH